MSTHLDDFNRSGNMESAGIMGFVEILYKDQTGLRIEEGKIEEVKWEYCAKCRTIATDGIDEPNLGIFICNQCLEPAHESA